MVSVVVTGRKRVKSIAIKPEAVDPDDVEMLQDLVLAAVNDGKVSLIAGVTADATTKVKAGELVNFVALQVGGKGGGRADMAQAGGTDASGLPAALAAVAGWVGQRVQ
jgi:alanyl-tRNA synthetase